MYLCIPVTSLTCAGEATQQLTIECNTLEENDTMNKARSGKAKSGSHVEVRGILGLLFVSFLLGVTMGQTLRVETIVGISSISKEKKPTTTTPTPTTLTTRGPPEIRFTVERNHKDRDPNLKTSADTESINSRILTAVFGEVKDPMLRTLQDLSNAQPSLTESVDRLESQIAEFALKALEAIGSTVDMNITISLLKEPGPPTIFIRNATYGPKSQIRSFRERHSHPS
jgi:hypothetical protein